MKPERDTRSAWIKLRVTPAEKEAIAAKAAAQGQTVTDFIRPGSDSCHQTCGQPNLRPAAVVDKRE